MSESRWTVAAEGYFDKCSYEGGEVASLHLGATNAHPSGRVAPADHALDVDIELARVGASRDVVARWAGVHVDAREIPEDAAANGARWPASLEVPLSSDWRSGWYEARISATRPDGSVIDRRSGFVLRAATGSARAATLLHLCTNTWNAYNDWGFSNLYLGGTAVSFRRPLAHGFLDRPDAPQHRNANTSAEVDLGQLAWAQHSRGAKISSWSASSGWPTWEAPFVAWAEAAGYDFDYAVNADLDARPEVLDGHALVLSVGHDEYWSSGMRDSVEGFIAGGGNVAFLSGNTSFWQVRFDHDGDTMVSFKDTARRADPLRKTHPHLLTSMWSDPIIGRPENRMTGVSFSRGGYARIAGGTPRGQRGYTVWRPGHWMLEGTDLRYGDLLGETDTVIGYECDGCETALVDGLPVPTGADGTPKSFEIVGSAPARLWSVDVEAGVNEYPTGLAAMRTIGEMEGVAHTLFGDMTPDSTRRIAHGTAVLGSYTAGGTVVTTGCTDWTYGISGRDPLVVQVTQNILDRLSKRQSLD